MRELLGQDHALNEQAVALAQFVKRASGEERAKLKAGISPEKEAAVLAAWKAKKA